MNIYVYSDESGVFDKNHNDYFVFGGLICLGNEKKELWARKYSHTEKEIRKSLAISKTVELKASFLDAKRKNSIYRSLNDCYKFGAVIEQKRVLNQIFQNKKDKQRYLDFAYKIAIKYALVDLINKKILVPDEVENICFNVDEHTTATNGRYELREALEQELKTGTYNLYYNYFFPPVFPKMKSVELRFCDSSKVRLVRAADIVANHFYYIATHEQCNYTKDIEERKTFIKMLP